MGERVEGSSLFDVVDAIGSDLYVIPQLRTAFLNPFAERPALALMCGFYDVDGNPLASAPQQILRRAQRSLEASTGCRLEALEKLWKSWSTTLSWRTSRPATSTSAEPRAGGFARARTDRFPRVPWDPHPSHAGFAIWLLKPRVLGSSRDRVPYPSVVVAPRRASHPRRIGAGTHDTRSSPSGGLLA